jgi:hypothetical protein
MSSESTDETFEQHKRLRTRADDYVHKPIEFGKLLEHIQAFVKLDGEAAPVSLDGSMVETDIGLGAPSVDLSDAEILSSPLPRTQSVAPQKPHSAAPASPEAIAALPSLPPDDGIEVADVEVATDLPPEVGPVPSPPDEEATVARFSASVAVFRAMAEAPETPESPDAQQGPEEETRPHASVVGLMSTDAAADSSPAPSIGRSPRPRPSTGPRAESMPPSRADAENARLRQELERQRVRISELDEEARAAEARIAELDEAIRRDGSKDQQVQKLQRELDDAKAKLASGKTGGSARDLLDLREQLNR